MMAVANHYIATTDPSMNADLTAASLECLGAAGFEYSGETVNQYDLVDTSFAVGDVPAREQINDCVIGSAEVLYPEIVSFLISW